MQSLKKMTSEEANSCPGSVGDLIVFQRQYGLYNHYGVRVENDEIVHLTSARGLNTSDVFHGIIAGKIYSTTNPSIGVIEKEKCSALYKEGDKLYAEHCSLPTREILDRANSKVGEVGYNLLSNNCEHFARWCCDGERKSKQADALIPLLSMVASLSITILCILFACMFRRQRMRLLRTLCDKN